MNERVPAPELIRFLLTKWPFSGMKLADAQTVAAQFSSDDWHGFDRAQIERDMEAAIPHREQLSVNEIAQPVVLCLFDIGHQGKTTFASLLRGHGLPTFSTDKFVGRIKGAWHSNDELRELAKRHHPNSVDHFIRDVQQNARLADSFIRLFFDEVHGFNEKAPVSVIEGFLWCPSAQNPPKRLDEEVARVLTERKYRVWVAKKPI